MLIRYTYNFISGETVASHLYDLTKVNDRDQLMRMVRFAKNDLSPDKHRHCFERVTPISIDSVEDSILSYESQELAGK